MQKYQYHYFIQHIILKLSAFRLPQNLLLFYLAWQSIIHLQYRDDCVQIMSGGKRGTRIINEFLKIGPSTISTSVWTTCSVPPSPSSVAPIFPQVFQSASYYQNLASLFSYSISPSFDHVRHLAGPVVPISSRILWIYPVRYSSPPLRSLTSLMPRR